MIVSVGFPSNPTRERWFISYGDSGWTDPTRTNAAGWPPYPVVSRRQGTFLVWLNRNWLTGENALMFSELGNGVLAYSDTAIFPISSQDSDFSGAVWENRRWAARAQTRRANDLTDIVRVAYSDTLGIWHEVESRGYDSYYCAIAPLSDSVALMAHSGWDVPLKVETLTNGVWTDSAVVDPSTNTRTPRFALRPAGDLWLGWSAGWTARMASHRTGPWVVESEFSGIHPPFEQFVIAEIDLSRDRREKPLAAWTAFGGYRDVVCIAFPTETGWTGGYEVPDSDRHYLNASVARDRNGDAWVGWQIFDEGQTKWTHTYVRATATRPWFGGTPTPTVRWAISEPAPQSRWTVLRAFGSGEFEAVHEAEAGFTDTLFTWADPTAPRDALVRYRIRRESMDKRYEWLSEVATWWPKKPRLQLVTMNAGAVRDRTEFEIQGASAGDLDLRIYDIQGREVWKERKPASGTGRDRIPFDLSRATSPLHSGLYFVRAVDAQGGVSPASRFVVIR